MKTTDSFEAIDARDRADFDRSWAARWHLREKRKPSVWATEERIIAAGQSPLTNEIHDRCFLDWWKRSGGPANIGRGEAIRYSHVLAPHAVEPMDAADDPDVNVIVLMLGKRLMKTEGVGCNIIGRNVTDCPHNMIVNWPVEDSSQRYSRDVINPMIEATPALDALFVEARSRMSGRTIDYLRFEGGSLYLIYAGSKSKTRGMAAGTTIAEEIDAMPDSSQGEGDPIEKLLGRAEGFEAIKVLGSTPTKAAIFDENGKKKYLSKIEKWYDRSDQRKWFCPCRVCGVGQWLKWEQIRQLEKKSGEVWFYVCEKCDAAHNERQWRRLVSDGEWRPTAPFIDGIRGYWANGFNSLLPKGKGFRSKLAQFAVEGRRALNGTPEEKRVWINETKTETCAIETQGEPPPDWKPLFDRRETYNDGTDNRAETLVVPARCLVINAGIDLQLDRIELLWIGSGRQNETWSLDRVILPGDIQEDQVWDDLDAELERKFTHESGGLLENSMAFIDTAKWPDRVWAFLRRKSRHTVRACRGSKVRPHPIVNAQYTNLGSSKLRVTVEIMTKLGADAPPVGTPITVQVKGHWIGGDEATGWIYGRLAKEEPKPGEELPDGWHHFGMHCDEDYFQQLTSKQVFIGENGERTYENAGPFRREVHDGHKYALGAFRCYRRRWNFDAIERDLKEQADAKVEHRAPVERAAPQKYRTAIASRPSAW